MNNKIHPINMIRIIRNLNINEVSEYYNYKEDNQKLKNWLETLCISYDQYLKLIDISNILNKLKINDVEKIYCMLYFSLDYIIEYSLKYEVNHYLGMLGFIDNKSKEKVFNKLSISSLKVLINMYDTDILKSDDYSFFFDDIGKFKDKRIVMFNINLILKQLNVPYEQYVKLCLLDDYLQSIQIHSDTIYRALMFGAINILMDINLEKDISDVLNLMNIDDNSFTFSYSHGIMVKRIGGN